MMTTARCEFAGFYTTKEVKEAAQAEARKKGLSLSQWLHKIVSQATGKKTEE